MGKEYKWGDCIQCGNCCVEVPCGIPDNPVECELLTPINDYQYMCPHWPFEKFDHFTRVCMGAHAGCSNPNNDRYKEVWRWYKGGHYEQRL